MPWPKLGCCSALGQTPFDPLNGGRCRARVAFYLVAMAALIAPDAHDDDWTTRFIQEIEQWVRERYLLEVVSAGVAPPPTSAEPLAWQSGPLT